MANRLFEIDKEQKELIQKISSICGIKRGTIQTVWEYTLYAMFLQLMEDRNKNYSVLSVPLLGKILVKESKEDPSQYDTFLALNQPIKDELAKIKADNSLNLIEYFQKHFIDETIDSIVS